MKSYLPKMLLGLSAIVLLFSCVSHQATNLESILIPEMVLVKAGTFQMGDEHGDLWNECRPVHQVSFTYDFLIGKYEVTFEEFDNYCDATGIRYPSDYNWGRGRQALVDVNWWEAIAYCNWLSIESGLQPAYNTNGDLLDKNGQITRDITQVEGFRLPSEAEWEYAASGGHKASPIPPRYLYSGSDDIDDVAWYFGNSGEYIYTGTALTVDYSNHGAARLQGMSPKPVGEKHPNELGLYDMSGNVWEWCHDRYAPYTEETKVNPVGPETGHLRVMRGGSWIFGANDCRVANRLNRPPHERIFRLGFRVTRTLM